MPNYSRRRPSSHTASNPSTDTATDSSTAVSNAAAVETLEATNATSEEKEQVVVYLTQNSVTHHKDEIPETLAAMKSADGLGYGRKSMIPISDPYSDGHKTDQYAFGESKAASMTWWHDDSSLKVGQVKVGGSTLNLGAQEDRDQTSQELARISTDWMTALLHVGLTRDKSTEVVAALLMDDQGKPKLNHSGAGASNELMQLVSVLNRAEMGEFEISSLILSGHHYQGSSSLFGEVPGGDHEYDDNEMTGDTLDVRDIEALSKVFPKAFKQIDSVMFSACNTHDLGLEDDQGDKIETKDWIEKVFPDAQKMSLWQDIAPGSDFAAFWSGEFTRDVMAEESGKKPDAYDDARFRKTSKGTNHRYERDGSGQLEEIVTKGSSMSYPYNEYKGMRNDAHVPFHKREDLMKYVLKKK